MRAATLVISILNAAWALIVVVVIVMYSDPAFIGLDVFLGWAVTILCIVTATPAFILAFRGQWPKTALALSLAFPIGFAALLVGLFIYFTYYL